MLLDLILTSTSERVVVVSSRRETLDVIAKYVRAKLCAADAVIMLTGSVKSELREKRKNLFNQRGKSGARVCCLVDKMAEGQTLTGASHLVLLDATWNPAVDQQSMDRTHRIGECPCPCLPLPSVPLPSCHNPHWVVPFVARHPRTPRQLMPLPLSRLA